MARRTLSTSFCRGFFPLFLALLAIGCPGSKPPPASPSAPKAVADGPLVWKLSKSGLGFRLSNADDSADNPPDRKVAPASALGAEDAKKLAARLPALKADPDDEKDFAMRAKSIPAPRPGSTVTESFPPPPVPPPTNPEASGPLKVERHAPEGPVPLAPHLTVTFTAPMVPVATVSDLAKEHPPVRLVPEPPGKWRWLGTRTVMFQPEGRFPMATEYSVEIPAGTKGINGQTLATAVKWTFTTPAVTMKSSHPHSSSEKLEPLLFAEFDQAVEPKAILGAIELNGGRGAVPLALAEADEIEANDNVRRLVQHAEKGRFIAFKPTVKLPTATSFVVRLRAGAPSAEGPKTTDKEQSYSFSTYGPMALVGHRCGWGSTCPPLQPFNLNFSNPIDLKAFDKSRISVSPEIAGMKVDVGGGAMTISGRTKGRTKYTVTVPAGLADVHGQTMAHDAVATFEVGSAPPTMFGAEREMVVLDPASTKTYPIYTINEPSLRARVYAVTPEDWRKYVLFAQEWERPRKITAPGRLVYDKVLTPQKAPDELVTTPIDLAPALRGGLGQALVVVEPTRPLPKGRHHAELHVWVQSTSLGLDAMIENDQVTAWATRLADGAPEGGVEVKLLDAGSKTTDASGLARVPLTSQVGKLVVGTKGTDVVIVPESWFGVPSYVNRSTTDSLRWLVFDDRGMYKPGEEVHVKGWVRRSGNGRGGDIDAVPEVDGKRITYRVQDPRGAEIAKGDATADAHGGFDLAFKLPANANLGQASLHVELNSVPFNGTSTYHAFQIEEFRRPEFEVTAKSSEGPHSVGKHAIATLSASYYSGGGLPNAPVRWNVTRSTVGFTPPNRSDYHFGPVPTWAWSWRGNPEENVKTETWEAKTDPQGVHRLRVDFDALDPSYPMNLAFTGHVEDVNRQQWAGSTSMIVHPADVYVGLKTAKNFIRAGENIDVELVTTDLEGKAAGGRHVVVKASRTEWEQKGTEYVSSEVDVQTCEVDSPKDASPANEKLRCALRTTQGGQWKVVAIVTDEHGRNSQTALTVYVTGTDRPKDQGIDRAKANVLLDKKEYKPGEIADVLVVAPFSPAEGLLTVRRQGIIHVERFTMTSSTHALKVKLDETLVPNAEVHVDLVGQDFRENAAGDPDVKLPKRPAYAAGAAAAKILPITRTLGVTAVAKRNTIEPGGATSIEVDVRDPSGRAAPNAEVSVVVVDESVLALSGYKTPDPIAVFYPPRPVDVHAIGVRSAILLGKLDPKNLRPMANGVDDDRDGVADMEDAPRGGAGFGSGSGRARTDKAAEMPRRMAPAPSAAPIQAGEAKKESKVVALAEVAIAGDTAGSVVGNEKTPIATRTNFAALAVFAPKVKTDGQGHASVPVKLPDSLTRYRVMAVAATTNREFGANESTLTARLPLMVRPSAPRFANFGDKFELPIVIQNQTDAPIEAGVIVRSTNAVMDEPAAKRVKIPANDRVEVRFPTSTVKAGTARFQIGTSAPGFSDASQIEIPVYTPATTEAFATYGEIDEGAIAQPVKMPANVFPQFGGLEITTSSTQLQALTDAVIYLTKYPFECNEQLASRVMAIAALRDVLSAFKSKDLPSKEALVASMAVDFEKLKRRQHYSGGWGFWQEEPWPYLTIHVAHSLVRAKEKGYTPDATMLARAQQYLRAIESHIPVWYGEDARRSLISYALFVRKRMGDPDVARAKRLMTEAGGVDKLPIEAVGWIWPTISDDKGAQVENEAIRRHVANRVTETAGAAHFVSGYKDSNWVLLHSDRRADGVLLESMIGDQKDGTIIPKLVKGLLGHRTKGRWGNTQENAFVLLALDKYFNTYEKVTPDFVARAWLGDRFAGEHTFKGRTTEYSHIGIPMQFLASEVKAPQPNLILAKDGPGRLYYRVGMQYAPTDLKLPPADYGFVVSRTYEGAEKAEDVKRDADGTWRAKAGAKVRVRVTMVAPSRRYHVALVDFLPAGLEPMNPALAVTGEIPKDPKAAESKGGRYWYWQRTWYEHQNMRDERVEAFASLLWDGVWEYNYVARATTPGAFVVPPAKAEEMYAPETFGRSAGDRFVVE